MGTGQCLVIVAPSVHGWSMKARLYKYMYITIATASMCLGCLVFVWFGLNLAFNNLSVISRRCLDVTGSSMLTFRVLPHWNITPQTLWHYIPPSHIVLTLSWPVLALLSKRWVPSERAASTIFIFKVFGMTWPGINLQPPGHKVDALPLSHCAGFSGAW